MSSATRLVAPMTDVGRTALSVEIRTNAAAPCGAGDLAERVRRQHVVLDRLDRVVFHHRHVLVGCRVQDDRRRVLGKDGAHPLAVADVGHERNDAQRRPRLAQLAIDAEERELGALGEQQAGGSEAGHLPRQLRSDRPAGAGHEHRGTRRACGRPRRSSRSTGARPSRSSTCEVADATDRDALLQDLVHRRDDAQPHWNAFAHRPAAAGLRAASAAPTDITMWSIRSSRTSRGRSAHVPSTGTPWMTVPTFCGSSSTNPRISRSEPGCD